MLYHKTLTFNNKDSFWTHLLYKEKSVHKYKCFGPDKSRQRGGHICMLFKWHFSFGEQLSQIILKSIHIYVHKELWSGQMDTHKHAHWSDAVATMSHSPQAGSTKNHDIIFSSLLKVFQIIIGKAFPQCLLTIKRNYIVPICLYQTLQIVFSLDS